jgi:uncharacterized protein (TIGR02453 family)
MDNKRSSGFPQGAVAFLTKLSKNNNRDWFLANRNLYDKNLLEPAIQFVVEMGAKLQNISPNIQAIPKIDKSIFRIHRDVRFSKNKEPYKTNMGLYFWEGPGKKMEGSGFYFHLEPKRFGIGGGMYQFTKEQLKKYRDNVSDPVIAAELNSIINKILKRGEYKINGKNYKKIPRGYDPNSKYAYYLLYDSIYVWYDGKDIKILNENNVINFIYKIFKDMSPLHMWLVNNIIH